MPLVVEVEIRLPKERDIYLTGGLDLSIGDLCIVQTKNALELGRVVSNEMMLDKTKRHIYRVKRKLTKEDFIALRNNKQKNREAYEEVLTKIKQQEIDMKLTSVNYSFDRKVLFIYYTAEGRIDFRQLIKDLGHTLKTRIQMVQIGVRDEAKILGGIGPCGLPICCKTFLKKFTPVSLDMVKDQNLTLNPAKISGICGRLICCIAYENELYRETGKLLPKIDSKVSTPEGVAVVEDLNIPLKKVVVKYEDGKIKSWSVDQISFKHKLL